MKLDCIGGGAGSRICILLHGLGATREVWRPLINVLEGEGGWRWSAPDLRGHGRSPPGDCYAVGMHAVDIVETVGDALDGAVVLGHSLGGAVALALASGWFGAPPAYAFALGVKVAWTARDLDVMAALSRAPVKMFDVREAAVDRYLKVAGLFGLVAPDDLAALAGVRYEERGWRLAMAPGANAVGGLDMTGLMAAARSPVSLARGATDGMVGLDELRGYDPGAVDLTGLGHSAMVQDPRAVWNWVRSCLG